MKLVVISDTGEQIEARCDRCRHWKPEPDGLIRVGRDLGYRAAEEPGYGRCSSAPWLEGMKNSEPAGVLAFVADVDQSGAALATRARFGCASFERKEPA